MSNLLWWKFVDPDNVSRPTQYQQAKPYSQPGQASWAKFNEPWLAAKWLDKALDIDPGQMIALF